MLLLDTIKILKEQAKFTKDSEFIDFANNFETFLRSHNDMNINRDSSDLEPIKNLFTPYISKDKQFDKYEKLDNEQAMFYLSYLTELQTNHFINYTRFYKNNFSLEAKMMRFDKKIQEEKIKIYEEMLQKGGVFENIGVNNARNLIDYLNSFDLDNSQRQKFGAKIDDFDKYFSQMDDKQAKSFMASMKPSQNKNSAKEISNEASNNQIEDTENAKLVDEVVNELTYTSSFSDEIDQKNKSIEHLKKIKNSDEMIAPQQEPMNFFTQKAVISTQQVIDFIKNEELIEFPFPAESTVQDDAFMVNFKNSLKKMPNDQLRQMITSLRNKNAILRQQISELDIEENQLHIDLRNELINNQKLSEYKEIASGNVKDEKSKEVIEQQVENKIAESHNANNVNNTKRKRR